MAELIDKNRLKSMKEINKANFNSVEGIRKWIDSQPTTTEAEIRAKAIFDMVEAIKKHTMIVGTTYLEDIDEIAEQLKERE